MAQELTNLILRLAEDPRTLEEFSNNPEQYLRQSGLSSEQQAIISSKDAIKLREAIASDISVGDQAAFEWVVVIVNVESKTIALEATRGFTFSQYMKR
ncbi:hypothetical protein ACTHQF_00180 [Pedobacter sp. SAFR-022]|uniref:hypothetical protein n=1 Tax=Pedobacter sp. SAFR-022 TaxID=3436861 RepID=UPI003F806C3C